MACFFCDSIYHISHNCLVYISDEERQNRATMKNCCWKCLGFMQSSYCVNCESRQKCYICFQLTHHTVYCPDRNEASKITMPRIDNDLILRFMQILNKMEQYLIAIDNPLIFESAKLQHFKVVAFRKLQIFEKIENFSGFDFVAIDEANYIRKNDFIDNHHIEEQNNIALSMELTLFYITNLAVNRMQCPSQVLLKLLSPKTKILKIDETQFHKKLTFRKILENAPNLEEINIYQSDIEIGNSWPEDLLQYSQSNNLRYLYLHIRYFYFNIKSLVALIKKKPGIYINLYITLKWHHFYDEKKLITNEIENFFVRVKDAASSRRCLTINFSSFLASDLNSYTVPLDYVLKNDD